MLQLVVTIVFIEAATVLSYSMPIWRYQMYVLIEQSTKEWFVTNATANFLSEWPFGLLKHWERWHTSWYFPTNMREHRNMSLCSSNEPCNLEYSHLNTLLSILQNSLLTHFSPSQLVPPPQPVINEEYMNKVSFWYSIYHFTMTNNLLCNKQEGSSHCSSNKERSIQVSALLARSTFQR
jgi:hypothetical protein